MNSSKTEKNTQMQDKRKSTFTPNEPLVGFNAGLHKIQQQKLMRDKRIHKRTQLLICRKHRGKEIFKKYIHNSFSLII